MLELRGKYNTAKIFTDNIDNETISQVIELLNQDYIKDAKIRIMPDCHAGAGCVIGTTMTISDKVCPNLVGVDIGCGMLAVRIAEKDVDLPKLDDVINTYVPAGFNVNDESLGNFSHLNDLVRLIYRWLIAALEDWEAAIILSNLIKMMTETCGL